MKKHRNVQAEILCLPSLPHWPLNPGQHLPMRNLMVLVSLPFSTFTQVLKSYISFISVDIRHHPNAFALQFQQSPL